MQGKIGEKSIEETKIESLQNSPTETFVVINMPGLECPICLGTLRAAVETDCGHAFCAECLEVSLARSGGTCPVCRSNVTSSHPSYTLRELAENAQGQRCVAHVIWREQKKKKKKKKKKPNLAGTYP
jgi:late competence protein required for DNA uptake (superfamily II DNA/RNA helicase)